MPSPDKPVIRIAPNNQVFDLPVIVAIEMGLFEQAGLDVRFSATHADREKDSAQRICGSPPCSIFTWSAPTALSSICNVV